MNVGDSVKKFLCCGLSKPIMEGVPPVTAALLRHCLTQSTIQDENPVPLKSIDVQISIEGFIANVTSTLRYKNVEKNPIEARFEFPMDDQSAVYQFEAQIEDRVIIAECQEKKQAKETYDEAIKHGYSAALMEEEDSSSDIFCCLLGNLPPDTEAVIKFGYVTELSLQPDGVLMFSLPTLLNPCYNPSSVEARGTKTPLDVTYIPASGKQPYSFHIKAAVSSTRKVLDIKSTKDELEVTFNDEKTKAEVSLAKPFAADHDFTLFITYDEYFKPHIILEKGKADRPGILKQDVLMLNFFPDLKESDYSSKHEFIFIVDRSGSMQGLRIEGAKAALLLFLKSLPPGCYFNIVGFGSNCQMLFPEGSREYSEETLKTACDHQEKMSADLGGTEILRPLQFVYSKPPMTTHARQILLLTDGQVGNTQAVIELVKNNAQNTRMFSFGIGEGASTALVKGIARAGRGKAEFVQENERMQPIVVNALKAAMQASVTEIQLDWQLGGSTKLIQMPKEMPPIFSGDRLIVYAVAADENPVLDGRVQLKGKIGDRSIEYALTVDASGNFSTDNNQPIHRLAAKAQIKQLQDEGKDEHKASIILLSTAANIISCHTSMVGVDKDRKEKVVGNMVQRKVPMMMDRTLQFSGVLCSASASSSRRSGLSTSSWGACRSAPRMASACMPPPSPRVSACSSRETFSIKSTILRQPPTQPVARPMPDYMLLVSMQTFSGQWKLNVDFANALHTTFDVLQREAPVKSSNVWATVLAIVYLEEKFADKKDELEMILKKARQWLDREDREGLSVDELMEKSKETIRKI